LKREYTFWLIAFLVLLRLAIGWHFFVEGVKKVESIRTGKTVTNTPFSSAAYLRGASGPLADVFRWMGGDPDREALARLDVSVPAEQAAGRQSYKDLIPEALKNHYEDYHRRLVAHLELTDVTMKEGKGQKELSEAKLDQAKEKAVRWMLGLDPEDTIEIEVRLATGPVKIKRTPPQRIEEYRERLKALRDMEERQMPTFQKPVRQEYYRELRSEVTRLRTEILRDLDTILTTRLDEALTDKQVEPLKFNPVPAPETPLMLRWTDRIVSWGLLIVGGCLLLGLCTRFACVAGALFLLSFYLAQPALLGVPDIPRAEGFYFIINKNVIEMLALLALAATPSGRWLGLDALLYYMNPFRKRDPRPGAATTPSPEKQPLAVS